MSDPLAHSGAMPSKTIAMNLRAKGAAMKLRAKAAGTKLLKKKHANVAGYLVGVCLCVILGFVVGRMVPRSALGWVPAWIPDLLGIIFSVQWLASVGIPVMATLIAVGAAGIYLTRQISHDQRLVKAERRRAQASVLATSLRDGASLLARAVEVYEERSVWKDGESMKSILVEYDRLIRRGSMRATENFGKSPMIDDIDWSADLFQVFPIWEGLESSDVNDQYSSSAKSWTLASLIGDYHEFLVRTAEQLEDWDGGKSVPKSGAMIAMYGTTTYLPSGGMHAFARPIGAKSLLPDQLSVQGRMYTLTLEVMAEFFPN
ncbi:hypothetical protein [Rhodococcus sp. IEGM 1379]|uniref:hypothetical protein n=1 Tax=Rhodococcus sp. IEGM 1379 TaxID=3047086 RepID=UPI0024B6A08F|nr:hypothetical protein [Rhodococcus sp. IEGM 1379]MDI9914375.1 hypothetical protein [Rhodococcus sp. IEGM 1379]